MQTTVPTANNSPVLMTQDLTVTYGDFTAVNQVSLRAEAGKILGLLGPNGAGKTSVIRALTTIVRPSAGREGGDSHPPDAIGGRGGDLHRVV